MLTSAKLKGPWYQKLYLLPTSFRQGVILIPPPPQNKPLKRPHILGLRCFKFNYSESAKVSIYNSSDIPTGKILSYNRTNVKESDHEELLGITIDNHLDFKKRIDNLYWNANCKLHVLRRMRKYLAIEKEKLLGNTLIDDKFNSASLIWMLCQKTLYLKTEKIDHKTLRITDQPNASSRDLLECNDSTSFHQQYLQSF